jgi:predicted nucleic acid-binding protein
MKYTADTGFFIKLIQDVDRAKKICDEIIHGKSRLVIPTVVIVELSKYYLKLGKNQKLSELLDLFETSHKIDIIGLEFELAKKSGKIGNSYKCKTADAIILATAVESGYTTILTEDVHFQIAEKQGKVKLVRL